jgi:hypothetical protein
MIDELPAIYGDALRLVELKEMPPPVRRLAEPMDLRSIASPSQTAISFAHERTMMNKNDNVRH